MTQHEAPSKATPQSSRTRNTVDPNQLVGETIADRYVIEKAIGKGGMGVVYLARQQPLDRLVVVKVLRTHLVEDDEAIARFEREAQGLSKLQHPNIVTIHDFGWDGDQAFIVMEYVDGETLSVRARREGPLRLVSFLNIAAQLLQGIGAAHSQGLLHRDIKPANIMLQRQADQHDVVKILDFGLAKLSTGENSVTKEQSLVGSAGFLAPEQIVGLDVDHRLDIYAMGVLFYYMLTGRRPFKADGEASLLYKTVHERPIPLAEALPQGHDIPEGVIEVVHTCLKKNPDRRPGSAREVLEMLAQHTPCLLYTSPSPRDRTRSRMPSSA